MSVEGDAALYTHKKFKKPALLVNPRHEVRKRCSSPPSSPSSSCKGSPNSLEGDVVMRPYYDPGQEVSRKPVVVLPSHTHLTLAKPIPTEFTGPSSTFYYRRDVELVAAAPVKWYQPPLLPPPPPLPPHHHHLQPHHHLGNPPPFARNPFYPVPVYPPSLSHHCPTPSSSSSNGLLSHHGFHPPQLSPSPSLYNSTTFQLRPGVTLTPVASDNNSSSSVSSSSSAPSPPTSETSSLPPQPQTRPRRRNKPDTLVPPNCPLTKSDIVQSSIDDFNEKVADMTDDQQHLLKDKRRRGKNRIAARKSRERKMAALKQLRAQVACFESKIKMVKISEKNYTAETENLYKKLLRKQANVQKYTRLLQLQNNGTPTDMTTPHTISRLSLSQQDQTTTTI